MLQVTDDSCLEQPRAVTPAHNKRLNAARAWVDSMVAAGFRVHLQEHGWPLVRPYDQVILTYVKSEADGAPLPVFSGWYPSHVSSEVREVLKGLGWFTREGWISGRT